MREFSPSPPLTAVGLISAGALAYEILLTRIFAIVHWHHLVAIAISLALLGYGASGTFLAIVARRLKPHFAAAFIGNALLFSLSSLACVALAQRLPFDPQALSWDPWQTLYLGATFFILAVPFFAAANCIGLALWQFQDDIPRLYGFDLIGAGLGASLVLLGLSIAHPAHALLAVFTIGMLVCASAAYSLRWHWRTVALIALLVTAGGMVFVQPSVHPAAYKDLARAMSVYGAHLETELSGVAGTVSLVRNEQVPVRYAAGLSLQSNALPPPQSAVFVDGDAAGTLADYSRGDASRTYLHDLVSALPYALRHISRVAVVNAGTGERVHQAIALGASGITAIEPNPQLYALACERYRKLGPRSCDPSRVNWQIEGGRAALAASTQLFDLISLAADADPAGLDALNIDFDFTRQALQIYLNRLTPAGMLMVEGPTQVPPRLSMRLLETADAALRAQGIAEPASHIAMIRGWQRFVLLVSTMPLDAADETAVRTFAERHAFDLIWLPHIRPGDANRHQQLSEPQFYQRAAAILSPSPTMALADSRYRLGALDDNRPFPTLSTRWQEWRQALGHGERAEIAQLDAGLLIGTLTLALATLAGIVLIALPLLWLDRPRRGHVTTGQGVRTLAYFGLLGLAFLFLEIAWIQRLQLFLGHPVYATTAVLAAFLLFAGLGSLWAQRRADAHKRHSLVPAVAAILALSLVYLWFVPGWLAQLAGLSIGVRVGVVLLLLAPLAFAMGIPFPTGLRQLGLASPALIPWAWGINGCTSVISAAAAPLLAIEIGFDGLIVLAVGAYLMLPLVRPAAAAASTG